MTGKWEQYGPGAETLYVQGGKTLDDLAQMFPVSRKTLGEWCLKGQWVQKKKQA